MRIHGEETSVLTVADLVRERSTLGAKPFLHLRGETLTYAEADERSDRYADALRELGVGRASVVAAFLYNSIDATLLWFACAKLGAVWAPLNVSMGPTDLGYSLGDTNAEVLVVDEELMPKYTPIRGTAGSVRHEIMAGTREAAAGARMLHVSALGEGARVTPSEAVTYRDPAAIVYTGGSTGAPKGVLVPQLYYISVGMRYRDVARATADDVMFECGYLFHSGGQGLGIAGPMFCQMTTVMVKWFSVSQVWDTVKSNGCTVIHLPGTMLGPILDKRPPSPEDRQHRVRIGLGAGTAQVRREVRDEFERRFRIRFLEVYAQTEMGVLVVSERMGEAHRPGSSGRSHGWAEMAIVDDSDVRQPPNTIGEIVARPLEPYTFMLGYANKTEQTMMTARNYWHHTGDIGYLDDDGYLYLVGRQAHWIRRRGENISSVEVESVLLEHPAVLECGVVGVPAELGDEDVKAYVRLRPEMAAEPIELVRWCEERIAPFKAPRYIEFVAELPRTAAKGEIERSKLKQAGIGQAWDRMNVEVRT